MKNAITCPNCNNENQFYNAICTKCNSFLRERVVNIDLWSILWKIIETPSIAFRKIIYAEHKNFIVFLTILLAIKYFIFSLMLAVPVFSKTDPLNDVYTKCFYFIPLFSIVVVILSVIYKTIFKSLSIPARFKDIFSVLIYSNSPLIFALVIFFPVEMVLYGEYLFTYNPSPFVLKASAAYILAAIELLILIWSIILSIIAIFTTSKSVLLSIIFGLVFYSAVASLMVFSMKYLF